MKGTKILIIIAVILLYFLSWNQLFSNSKKEEKKYYACISKAEEKKKMGIDSDALSYYKQALKMKENLELRCTIAKYYRELKYSDNFLDWCSDLTMRYPYKKEGYELLADYYNEKGEYYDCYKVIKSARKRNIKSDQLSDIDKEIYHKYDLVYLDAVEVKDYSMDYCPVMNKDGFWGFADRKGEIIIPCVYKGVSPFVQAYTSVWTEKDPFYLIDTAGVKKFTDVEKKKIEKCSAIGEWLMVIVINGEYQYANINFEILDSFGKWDYAGVYNEGAAAVKNGSSWYILNSDGAKVSDIGYEDIKLDCSEIAFRNGTAFVKQGGKYHLMNTKGEKIGSGEYEDAKVFASSEATCVKVDGKWGFVDQAGNMVIDPKYEDARPFVNGYAGVKINGKWGYISPSNELVIPAEFDDVRDFLGNGRTLIKTEDEWYVLILYRLNS